LIQDRENEKTDPRVLRTRKLIDEAFLAVLDEKGFEELSVQEVADRAGINRATFYAHYGDKYDLLSDLIRKSLTEELSAKDLLDRDLDEDSVRSLFTAVIAYVTYHHEHCKPPHRHLDWLLRQEITEYCSALFESWADRGKEGSSRTLRRMEATAAAGALYALVLEWLAEEKEGPVEAYVALTLPLITNLLSIHHVEHE
jgi:AcrR family transcriptional regulator